MQLTIAAWDDRVFPVEIDASETVATLQAILEAESGLPAAQQQLLHHGRPVPPTATGQTLESLGIHDNDMLMLMPQQPQRGAAAGQAPQQQQQQQQQRHDPMMDLNEDGTAKAPVAFIQAVKANAELMSAVQEGNPTLATAIRNEDIPALQGELKRVAAARREAAAAAQRERELLEADPFDPDVQRRIEEMIQKQNIEENLAAALEHTPEVFGSVEMLYVDMEVNGVPVKAFVDSGAQMTIMTHEFASKCYLTRLLDTRFAGVAVGVGSSKILGRIHQAPLKVAGHFTTCSITVLEQRDGPQFIFGLDMLKRHQCVLDMAAGELRFGSCDATLSFLPEHQIPKDFKRHIEEVSKQQAEKNVEDARAESTGGGAGTSAAATAAAGPTPMDTTGGPVAPPTNTGATAAAGAATTAAQPAPAQHQQLQPPAAAGAGRIAAGSPATAAAAAAAGSLPPGVKEADVVQLVGLGFSREMAIGALQAMGGNVDAAASMLFGM